MSFQPKLLQGAGLGKFAQVIQGTAKEQYDKSVRASLGDMAGTDIGQALEAEAHRQFLRAATKVAFDFDFDVMSNSYRVTVTIPAERV